MAEPWSFQLESGTNGTPVVEARKGSKPLRITEDHVMLAQMRATSERRAAQARMQEAAPFDYNWLPAWAEFLSDFRRGWMPPIGTLQDRRAGANWPFYRTDQELALHRAGSRILAGINQHGGGLIGGLSAYIIDTGMHPKCTPKDGTRDARDVYLCEVAESIFEEFYEREAFDEKQIAMVQGSLVDDGACPRLFNQSGYAHYRAVHPEQILQPSGSDYLEWSFGIRSPKNDLQRPVSAFVRDLDNTQDGEEVPFMTADPEAHDCLLYIAGFAPYPRMVEGVKRGMPLFTYGTRDAFNSAEKLINNMGHGAAVRQAFAYMRQHKMAGQTSVQSFVDGRSDYTTPKMFDPSTTVPTEYVEAGRVEDISGGWEFVNPPANPETQYAVVVADYLYRAAGALWHAPEWLLSGNASNMGAYVSSLVAESPFVKVCRQAQAYYRRRFTYLLQTVLRFAVWAGRAPRECLERVKVTLTLPSVEARDKDKEAARHQIYVGMGIESRQQVAEELGIDFDRTISDNKEFAAMTAPAQPVAGAGDKPPETEPGAVQDLPLPGATQGEPEDGDLDPFGDVSESLQESLLEAGFSGTITDKAGRKRKYVDGKPVAIGKSEPTSERPTGKDEPAAGQSKPASDGSSVLPPDNQPRQRKKSEIAEAVKQVSATTKDLAFRHKDALKNFTGSVYSQVNKQIREGPPDGPPAGQLIANLKEALAQTKPLDKPVTTYRGIGLSEEDAHKLFEQMTATKESGGLVEMPGFSSTSFDLDIATEFAKWKGDKQVVFEIAAKHGISAEGFSKNNDESEFLLPSGAKFKFLGAKEVPIGNGKMMQVMQMEQVI